jgi:hypothetical protein
MMKPLTALTGPFLLLINLCADRNRYNVLHVKAVDSVTLQGASFESPSFFDKEKITAVSNLRFVKVKGPPPPSGSKRGRFPDHLS